jgi:release factor glutamine methyltransferase
VIKSYDQLISESQVSRVEARLLLAYVLKKDKSWLLAHGDEKAPQELAKVAQSLFEKRRRGEPIAYLLGSKEFYGRDFSVGPGILIPRPETEHLLEWGLEVLAANVSDPVLVALDLGCGSGCIGLSLALEAAKNCPNLCQVTLTDLAPEALSFARRNALQLGLLDKDLATQLTFLQGSWFEALPPGMRFNLILSNPPYIKEDDAHLSEGDLRYEPAHALSSGKSGLQAIEEIIEVAPQFLNSKGWLVLEHGFDQADPVQALFRQHGYVSIESRRDLAGHFRLSAGSWA